MTLRAPNGARRSLSEKIRRVIELSREVKEALQRREPVVALETTLVAHGFPAEEGVRVGLEAEKRVRDAGAIPATVGVLDGAVRVGLSSDQLKRFTADARKVGPRDLAACVVQGAVGATTVAGTLAACRASGIGFMGTGGIGGVHRGERLDVSGDLGELARTEALVVCSGAKSFLDVPATMELLEALGVPVLGYRTDELPLFYAAEGGPPVPVTVETPEEAAQVARTHWGLRRHSAVVLAQPPPESLDVDSLVEQALTAAEDKKVSGPALTPFVLAFLHEHSGGETLRVNRDLVLANARLAAEVAVAYAGQGPA
jgi:pseudouridine-5'-phosphate glycosidase